MLRSFLPSDAARAEAGTKSGEPWHPLFSAGLRKSPCQLHPALPMVNAHFNRELNFVLEFMAWCEAVPRTLLALHVPQCLSHSSAQGTLLAAVQPPLELGRRWLSASLCQHSSFIALVLCLY